MDTAIIAAIITALATIIGVVINKLWNHSNKSKTENETTTSGITSQEQSQFVDKTKITQNIQIFDSPGATVVHAGGDIHYSEAKELLPEEIESRLKDGEIRTFCFISVDVVKHSQLPDKFSLEIIDTTLKNYREWLNFIITQKGGKELKNWQGDGGIFYFLQDQRTDKAVDNAVTATMEILRDLPDFNNTKNKLYFEGKRTDIRLRFGIEYGDAIYHTDAGNWRSEALNTAAKIQGKALPNSALITDNVYNKLSDDEIRIRLKSNFHLRPSSKPFKEHNLYIFSCERIIDNEYIKEFEKLFRRREKEYKDLGYWVDLYAIEMKFKKRGEEEKGETYKATNLIDECIRTGKNALICGESGSGKTFTCFKLFEELKKNYTSPEADLTEKIPLYRELSKIWNQNFNTFIKEAIDETVFNNDKDNYIIFLDGLNEVGDVNEQQRIFRAINDFAVDNEKPFLFVTTQTKESSFFDSDKFIIYEIQPFKREDAIEYMTKFPDKFKTKEEAEKFYDDLSDLMKDFVSKPIFLSILVSTYNKDNPVKINTPGELFTEYEEFLCGGRELRRQEMEKKYREQFIPFLAFNMCRKHEKQITGTKFNEYIENYHKEKKSLIDESEVKDIMTNRFKLMNTDENDNFEFIHQTLRDYFAGVYIKKENMSVDEIINRIYTGSIQNNDLINGVRFMVGINDSDKSMDIIKNFKEKDLYLTCELFAWSSVTMYDENIVNSIDDDVNINSREYLLNLNIVVSFYLKVLDLLQSTQRSNDPLYADYLQFLGLAYWNKLDYEGAVASYRKAIGIYEENQMQSHPEYALCYMNLGNAYDSIGDKGKAVDSLTLALTIFEKSVGKNHPYYQTCLNNLNIVRSKS